MGTVAGLASAVVVPYLVVPRHDAGPDAVFGGRLMPVVAPDGLCRDRRPAGAPRPGGAGPAHAAAGLLRARLPFSLTWWSFPFPLGTVVTGTSALALHTGATALAALAVVLYAGLVAAWVVVALRTARGGARPHLFLPPAPARS